MYIFIGEPNLVPPESPPIITPTFISLTCGQDIAISSFATVTILHLGCSIFNGSNITSFEIYKDGILFSNGSQFSMFIQNPDDSNFGTYTFRVITAECGATQASSTIHQQGQC